MSGRRGQPAYGTAGELPAVELASPFSFSLQPLKDRRSPPLAGRFKDRFLDRVDRWSEGCLYCGEPADLRPLPGSGKRVQLPLCDKHLRWAMATRRERYGKQAHILRGYVLAWCRLKGGDRDAAVVWLSGTDLGRGR
jgi:hypothetical protein